MILKDKTLYGSLSMFKVMPFLISDVSTATDKVKPKAGDFWGTKAPTTVISNNNVKVRDWDMVTRGC